MSEETISPSGSLLWRAGFFLSDLLPESNLQLLFPLGTFLLLLGWEYWQWFPLNHSRTNYIAAGIIMRLVVRFAYTASLVLWCVPVRNPSRKFFWWVFLPIGLCVLGSLAFFGLGLGGFSSVLEPESDALRDHLRSLPQLFRGTGIGLWATIAGAFVFFGALHGVREGRFSLPVRFRGTISKSAGAPGASNLVRRVFLLLIVSLVLVTLAEICTEVALATLNSNDLPRIFSWPRGLPAWYWLTNLFDPAITGVCAAFIFRVNRDDRIESAREFPAAGYALALLLPLAIAFLPRLGLKIWREFLFAGGGLQAAGFPPTWGALFALDSHPWIVLVFLIAWFEEFVLRECLQRRLTERLGLKRAILVVALLWWVLPVYFGFGPIPSLRIGVPGVSLLVNLLVVITYNIPLGWLYARTRSLWPVTLMHGAILLFRVGDSGYAVYFAHPAFYWVELALWIFAGWYLFKKFPADPELENGVPATVALPST
jgi:membrane protease YdiL (CAAX protease family)